MLVLTMQLGQSELGLLSIVKAKPQDVACLAKNIYMEARGEPIEGQVAVAQVTLNRLNTGNFGSTLCKVVYAKNQFSWTNEKLKPIKNNKEWEAAVIIATAVLKGSIHLPNFNALYYHTRQVRPVWAKTKVRIARIANHIFYA